MPPGDGSAVNDNEAPKLKNKPKPSSLRQQKLPAWQPILTAWTVIPAVVAVGVVFIPIGIALFLASDSVHEYRQDYTQCAPGNTCKFTLNITDDMNGDVYVYYYLENFYQNHRRYVKSRNDKQYLGNVMETSDCDPFDKIGGVPIAPCGAIANSMFNDTFIIRPLNMPLVFNVPLTTAGVLWSVDKDKKFKNPTHGTVEELCEAFKGTVKPPNWTTEPCRNGGFENVDFIVWMRTAALPNFRKLWRLVDRKDPKFQNGLPKGSYEVEVNSHYPVTGFGGKKAFIISTTSWAGGKNSFLGIAYLVVGCLAIVIAIVFVFIHIKFGHSVNELSNVSMSHQ